MTVTLYYSLNAGSLIPLTPFFFLRIALASQDLYISILIVQFFALVLWKMPWSFDRDCIESVDWEIGIDIYPLTYVK